MHLKGVCYVPIYWYALILRTTESPKPTDTTPFYDDL